MAASDSMMAGGGKTVTITIENLLTGQAFSPSFFVARTKESAPLYKLGDKASDALAAVAEGRGKPMPAATARANAATSSIRAHIEHVFAHQKNRFGLFIHTIGIKRAEAKLTLANLAYNFDRLVFHERRLVAA